MHFVVPSELRARIQEAVAKGVQNATESARVGYIREYQDTDQEWLRNRRMSLRARRVIAPQRFDHIKQAELDALDVVLEQLRPAA